MAKQSEPKTTTGEWQGWLLEKIIRFFGMFSLKLNQVLGKSIGLLLWWLPTQSKATTLINLQTAFPELSETETKQIAKASLKHLGMMSAELGVAWCWPREKLQPYIHVSQETQHQLDKLLSSNKGVLFLSPHIGSWEVLVQYLSWSYRATILYQPQKVASAESFMTNSRSRFGSEQAPTDIRGVRKLISALKQKQACLVLPDQDPGAKSGLHSDFFGYPARTMTLVSKLTQKVECEVVFVILERLNEAKGYELHLLPAETDIAHKDELTAVKSLNLGVEACVNSMPEQYLWSYKRYRKPPQGFKNIYK